MHSKGMMLSNTSQLPEIDTAFGIIICNKLVPGNTHDCLQLFYTSSRWKLPQKFQCSPLTIKTAPVPSNYEDSSFLSFGSSHFIVTEFNQGNCVQVTKLSEDNMTSDRKT